MASYLNIPNIIAAAVSRGADAIHPVRTVHYPVCCLKVHAVACMLNQTMPCCALTCIYAAVPCSALRYAMSGECISAFAAQGYGFLSENATFVDICKDHSIEFIGPTSDHINIMGDKSTARDTMKVEYPKLIPCILLRCGS